MKPELFMFKMTKELATDGNGLHMYLPDFSKVLAKSTPQSNGQPFYVNEAAQH